MGAPHFQYTCIRIGRCRVWLRGEGLAWFLEMHPEYKEGVCKKCTNGTTSS